MVVSRIGAGGVTAVRPAAGGLVVGLVTSDEPYVFYFATAGTYYYHMDGYEGFNGVVIVG